MRLSRFVMIVLGAALAVACGKDSNGPTARVASVTGIAGDSQIGTLGTQLQFSLTFTVLDSGAHPIRGLSVPWTVAPAGTVTFVPATSTSDANGVVSTIVRLGADTGVLTITANVPNFAPVVFHVLSLNPCSFGVDLAIPSTANGTLATSDCNQGGWYYDYYLFDTPAGQTNLRLTMSSTFDTWLDLYRGSDGSYIGFDDDVVRAVNTNSQLDIILPEASFVLGANSYDPGSTGTYIVGAAVRSFALNGCREVWVVDGVSLTDTLKTTDCADTSGVAHYYEVARVWADNGTVLTVAAHSASVNPKLTLYRLEPNYSRTLIAFNTDSSVSNPTAYLQATVAGTAPYDVLVSAEGVGEVGPYTLSITAVPPPSPTPPVTPSALWGRARARVPHAIAGQRVMLPRWPKPLPMGGVRR